MQVRRKMAGSMDIGLVSLPILCGLLGALLMGNIGKGADTFAKEIAPIVSRTEAAITNLTSRLDGIEEVKTRKAAELGLRQDIRDHEKTLERIEKDRKRIGDQADQQAVDAAWRARLDDDITLLNTDIDDINKRIAALMLQLSPESGTNSVPDGLPAGTLPALRIVLECDDKGAVVHPGGQRVRRGATRAELDRLTNKIKATGAVLLAVRPSGFADTYAEFQKVITDLAKGTNKIAVCFWPIETSEAINRYLSQGEAR